MTDECISCFETYPLSKMTVCSNGHQGGCTKCHMKLIHSKYSSGESAFIGDNPAQRCFMCRANLEDINMGKKWTTNLSRLMPIMMELFFRTQNRLEEAKVAKMFKYEASTKYDRFWDELDGETIVSGYKEEDEAPEEYYKRTAHFISYISCDIKKYNWVYDLDMKPDSDGEMSLDSDQGRESGNLAFYKLEDKDKWIIYNTEDDDIIEGFDNYKLGEIKFNSMIQ